MEALFAAHDVTVHQRSRRSECGVISVIFAWILHDGDIIKANRTCFHAVICVPRVSLFVLAICLTMFFADTFYVMGSSYTVCEDLLNGYTSC